MLSGQVQDSFRLAVHADDLLPGGMSHPGQYTCLGNGVAAFNSADATDGNMLLTEGTQKQTARLIVANHAHGQNSYAEIGKVIDGVPGAAGHNRPVAMAKDQHGSLA